MFLPFVCFVARFVCFAPCLNKVGHHWPRPRPRPRRMKRFPDRNFPEILGYFLEVCRDQHWRNSFVLDLLWRKQPWREREIKCQDLRRRRGKAMTIGLQIEEQFSHTILLYKFWRKKTTMKFFLLLFHECLSSMTTKFIFLFLAYHSEQKSEKNRKKLWIIFRGFWRENSNIFEKVNSDNFVWIFGAIIKLNISQQNLQKMCNFEQSEQEIF